MTRVVVDASVVVKWLPLFQREPLAHEAQTLLDHWEQGTVDLIAPDLIWTEVANVHWRTARQRRCTSDHAQASLAALHGHGLPTVASEPLIDLALQIALQHNRTAYDSLYVALAVKSNSELVTADEKLVKALSSRFPLRWLGAI